jgi:hypothetical protein
MYGMRFVAAVLFLAMSEQVEA